MRLLSMLLDHVILTFINFLFFIPLFIKKFSEAFRLDDDGSDSTAFEGPLFYLGLTGIALYLCKDCINGRSIAKRIIKHQVVDNKSGRVASPLQCFVRNIFCLIWFIEVFVMLGNPSRRLGDLVAGTKVIPYDALDTEQPVFKAWKLILPLILAFGTMYFITLPFKSFTPRFKSSAYVAGSYNATESKALEKMLNENLEQYLSAKIMVYDSSRYEHVKYISAIFILKRNYLEDENDADEIKRIITEYLYSIVPQNSFTGKAKYIYRRKGSMIMNSNGIGLSSWELKERSKQTP